MALNVSLPAFWCKLKQTKSTVSVTVSFELGEKNMKVPVPDLLNRLPVVKMDGVVLWHSSKLLLQ